MRFVRLCGKSEIPGSDSLAEFTVEEKQICIANSDGRLAAIDNICPHRQGPLAEGWLENGKVLCPWHAWAFDLQTGEADHDPQAKVAVYPVRVEGEDVLLGIESNS